MLVRTFCGAPSAKLGGMASNSSPRILVTGASGPIGSALLPSLSTLGADVTRLVRGRPAGERQIQWDPEQPVPPESVSGFDAVIHLAGESIMGRWTEAKKENIRNSRVHGTQNLAQALAGASQKPRVFVSGSASGFYGDRGDEILREDSRSGGGFLPKVCREWEAASQPAADAGIRTVNIRSGVVLTPTGGALEKMLPPFRLGLGGRLGSGRQWMSWIHIQDIVGAIHHILKTDSVQGPVNMVSPKPVTNSEFTRVLAGVLSRPAIFPVPVFALRTLFGRMADEVLLASQRVEPARLAASGYSFQFGDLQAALGALLKRN
jgi:hypothetical protein